MDPVTMGMLGSAAISAGSSIFGGFLGAGGQAATNAQQMAMFQESERFNENAAWEQRIWNKEMAETAYQRTMTDMRAAGLNPILAASLGPTPMGASSAASIGGGTSLGNPGSALQAGITGAGDAMGKAAAYKVAMTQAEKDQSATDLNKANEKLADKQGVKTEQDTRTAASAERLNDVAATVKGTEAALNAAYANSANATARATNIAADQSEAYGDSPVSKAVAGIIKMLGTAAHPNSSSSVNRILGGGGGSNALPPQQPSSAFQKWLNRPIGTPP